MRIPDPKANTTTEAYLAYKAGYLEQSELKPVLYEPYLHFDGWLAYWAGLTYGYPLKEVGKNLFSSPIVIGGWAANGTALNNNKRFKAKDKISVSSGLSYIISGSPKDDTKTLNITVQAYASDGSIIRQLPSSSTWGDVPFSFTAPSGCAYITISGRYSDDTVLGVLGQETDVFQNAQLEVGSAATAYEPYTGEPEMLTDEEALVAYLSGVTDTYPEEIKDPYDVRITGYLRYLVSARFGRPEYPVNNEEFYLSTMKPPVVPSGDPSSDIEMDDTAEAPFIDLKTYGDTYQQTYSGKNLIDHTNLSFVYSNSPTQIELSSINNGIRMVNNGGESQGRFAVFKSIDLTQYIGKVVRMKATFGTGGGIRLQRIASDGSDRVQMATTTVSDTEISFTVPDDLGTSPYLGYVLDVTVGGGTTIDFTNLIATVDSSIEPYEPYTGGIPAPNPDYPQPVNVVTGRQVVGVKGKNLFYGSNNTSGGVVSAWEGSKVTLEGTTTSSYANITGIDPMPTVFEAGTYTFSTDTVTNEYTKTIRIREGGENHDYTIPKGNKSITFTTSGSFTVRICFISSLSQNVGISDTFGLQLELGSEPTAYSPYGGANYEINLGKNLFDPVAAEITVGGLRSSGSIDYSATNRLFTKGFIKVEPNTTYTFQFKSGVAGKVVQSYALAYQADKTTVTGGLPMNAWYDSGFTFTTKPSDEFIRMSYHFTDNSDMSITDVVEQQLELGDTATEYAPYFEPIELCKIGNYQDYIYRDGDGDWYLHKETVILNPDGSEGWKTTGTKPDGYFYTYTTYYDNVVVPTERDNLASNCFTLYNSEQGNKWLYPAASFNGAVFSNGDGSSTACLRIMFPDTVASSVDDVEDWFENNSAKFYYPLATTTDTKITDVILISQLNALMEGGSYDGKTYIKVTATDPNLPGLLYVEAGKYD